MVLWGMEYGGISEMSNLCIDCSNIDNSGPVYLCKRNDLQRTNPVTGDVISQGVSCDSERAYAGDHNCGPDGRFWSPQIVEEVSQ